MARIEARAHAAIELSCARQRAKEARESEREELPRHRFAGGAKKNVCGSSKVIGLGARALPHCFLRLIGLARLLSLLLSSFCVDPFTSKQARRADPLVVRGDGRRRFWRRQRGLGGAPGIDFFLGKSIDWVLDWDMPRLSQLCVLIDPVHSNPIRRLAGRRAPFGRVWGARLGPRRRPAHDASRRAVSLRTLCDQEERHRKSLSIRPLSLHTHPNQTKRTGRRG